MAQRLPLPEKVWDQQATDHAEGAMSGPGSRVSGFLVLRHSGELMFIKLFWLKVCRRKSTCKAEMPQSCHVRNMNMP